MHFLSIHHVLHYYNGLHIALQISVPVIVSGWWACYIWDIDRKELHVIDPVLSGCSYAEQNKHHEDTINLLHQGLFTCMRAFFDQWKVDKSGWDARFYSGLHLPSSRFFRKLYGKYACST